MLLDYVVKFLGMGLGIAVIVAWFYAYAKTKLRGFALIATAGILKLVGWIAIATLTVLTSYSLPVIRYAVTPIVEISSFALVICGILSLIGDLSAR